MQNGWDMLTGSLKLNKGVSGGHVPFMPRYYTAKNIFLTVSCPNQGQVLYATWDNTTLTANGFYFTLSAQAPDDGYVLHWQVSP